MASSTIVAEQRRARWLDYDKGITILLVVYGHCLDTLGDTTSGLQHFPLLTYFGEFLYGFRMPLFFVVSGILVSSNLKKKGLSKYLVSRADLFYAMLLWGGIQISLKLWVHSPSVSYWSYLYLFIDPRQTGHFWYLNTFFCIGSLYAIATIKMKLKQHHQLVAGLVLYALSAYLYAKDINAGVVREISRYYFFFALGDAISVWIQDKDRQQRLAGRQVFLPLLAVFLCLQYWCTSVNLQHHEYGNFYVERKVPLLYFAEAVVGCAFSVSLSFLLQKYNRMRWLTAIGSYSLYVYLMHMIVISSIWTALKTLQDVYAPALLFSVWVAGVILPILLYNLSLRYGFWWLFTFHKPVLQTKKRYSA